MGLLTNKALARPGARNRRCRLAGGARLLHALWLLGGAAWAQGVSPGPLSAAHADLDKGTKCTSCHQLAGKTAYGLCLDCHAHRPLKEAIEAGHGLHPRRKEPCQTCHTEHKGTAGEVADWSRVGGQSKFDHGVTGFELKGQHDKVKCTACHKRVTKTGWILFAGVPDRCDDCHKNPHKFTDTELRSRCLQCHVVGGVTPKSMKPGDVPFDHEALTGVALVGKHAVTQCVKCHKGGNMSMQAVRICKDCHKSPHTGSQAAFVKRACTECHAPSRSFKAPHFDHKETGFILFGDHAKTSCRSCHAKDKAPAKPDCASCHKATHRTRFAAFRCTQCHSTTEQRVAFQHGELTKLALTGKHGEIRCRSCHRGKKPWQWEKFPTPDCQSCHRHANAHKGQFIDKPCTACHVENGSRKVVFDHDRDAKFPLLGAHQALAEIRKCKSCHPPGVYRTGKTACADCHKDAHKGTLGTGCERCHSPTVRFAQTKFDHATVKAFKLEGIHLEVPCAKCHPQRQFKTGKTACIDCHARTEPHSGKLGTDCARCHTPAKGAPLFQHETMTAFARVGAHLQVGCPLCHRFASGSPPSLGWTRGLPAQILDLRFPVMGTTCAQCHADPHQGGNGSECTTCHKLTAFRDVSASVHDTGAFRLGGRHASLPCVRCHGGGRLPAGSGEACQLCHRDDDPHGNALGPFCGECHQQGDWAPSPFSHARASFPLLGAHRTVECRRCHGAGTYQGLPATCDGCHATQAALVQDPRHTAELGPCESCHNTIGFRPALFVHAGAFTLVGHHRQVGCRNCHQGGSYVGTPDTCESCHLQPYLDPGTQPDHRALGYAITCGDCHTPAGWRPATAP